MNTHIANNGTIIRCDGNIVTVQRKDSIMLAVFVKTDGAWKLLDINWNTRTVGGEDFMFDNYELADDDISAEELVEQLMSEEDNL
jgi:hypothetical protein